MARRKIEDQKVRNLTKIGGKCLGLTIPIEIIRKLGWKERQKVEVHLKGKKIILKDWRRR